MRVDDVLRASVLGAWALGFVFAPSPRRLTPAAARGLIGAAAAARPRPPLAVGVFGNTTAGEIARVVEEAGLDGVQLHSLEGPGGAAVRAALAGRERTLLIIQAVPVPAEGMGAGVLEKAIATARWGADLVLLDTRAKGGFGGTGVTFPWALARDAGQGVPLLVAGGIRPENVEAALRDSGAWGVDVSSGIEVVPGLKDARLMERLFERVAALREAVSLDNAD